jgi:hypothetical protein
MFCLKIIMLTEFFDLCKQTVKSAGTIFSDLLNIKILKSVKRELV